MPTARSEFPSYTGAEAAADRVVHLVGLVAAALAVAWLLAQVGPHGTVRQLVAVALYGAGLLGMIAASAAYNMARPGRSKAVLRRLDHAMIFIMIAGSYTPYALCALAPSQGLPLLTAAWTVGALGAALKLLLGNRYRRWFIALYLAHGWLLLTMLRPIVSALNPGSLALLVAGGLVYSVGVIVHTSRRIPFHNALWHMMVLLAAGLHLGSIAQVIGG